MSARIKTTAGFGPSTPDEGRENLLPYGDTAFNAFGPDNALRAKGAPRVAELSGWVAGQCARDVLADDGFGAAIWAASDRGDITPAQAPLVVRSLLTAGVDTTVHGIGALLACLARTPAAWARLRADPTLVRLAFDEAMRLESPVQMFFRTAERDVVVGGHVVPEGEKGLVCFAAANRDPRRWEHPDTFDLDRDPSGHRRLRHGPAPVRRPARGPARGRGPGDGAAARGRDPRARRAGRAAPQQHAARLGVAAGPAHPSLTATTGRVSPGRSGPPRDPPGVRAAAGPARVRSWRMSRSNSCRSPASPESTNHPTNPAGSTSA